jgi:hypothetical protein
MNKEYPKIHARFEFRAICGMKYCQRKKRRRFHFNLTTDRSGLLKMERYKKEQSVFIVEQYFKDNEGFFPYIHT